MPSLVLRPALVSDAGSVLAFWSVAAEDHDRPPDSADAVRRLVERDPDALLLAFHGPELVGTVVAGWDGWRCHLYRLAVHPDHRRRGIARELVSRAEDRFARLGGSRADAMVLDDNRSAHAAWSATGYTRQSQWSRWVRPLPPVS